MHPDTAVYESSGNETKDCMQELRRRGKQPARSRGDDVQNPDLKLLYSMAQQLAGT